MQYCGDYMHLMVIVTLATFTAAEEKRGEGA